MSDEESKNSNLILIAAASAVISGGGAHLVTKDDVTSANIEECRSFSEHAREHERANCEIEKNKMLISCKRSKQ